MFKIDRSCKPDDFHIKNDIDLRSSTVVDYLVKDCHNKCYICEQKDFTDKEIEHIIPHQDDKKLKYDWYNLLLSCSHCNGIKRTRRIINCIETDPEEYIELRYKSSSYGFVEKIKVDVNENKNINAELLYDTIKILEDI